MDDDQIFLDKNALKAISSDTRISILKTLLERQKLQSEIAKELVLSEPTILEHLHQLQVSHLVEIVAEEKPRPWKYYKLTKLGRNIVEKKKMSIIIILTVFSYLLLGAFMFLYVILSKPINSTQGKIQAVSSELSSFGYVGDPNIKIMIIVIGFIAILLTCTSLIIFLFKKIKE